MLEMRSEIEVAVYEGKTLIQRCLCSSQELPDGRPGVIWRGVLYPLLPGKRIDVAAAERQEPWDQPFAVLPGEGATWVLIRGPASALTEARARLEATGIRMTRAGRWLGDPIDDVAFDWFLRFDEILDAGEITERLGRDPVDQYTAEARLIILEQHLIEMKAALAGLAEQLNNSASLPPEPPHADQQQTNERDVILEKSLAKIRDLEAQLAALPQRSVAMRSPTVRLQEELTSVLKALRPDITFLRDSMQVAVIEFHSRGVFYRMLHELPVAGGRPDGWKALRGAERWWERHLSTGQDDSARAYARFDLAARQWEVLIGWKGEQARDISWIKQKI
jgi:hypothetical protein